MKPRPQGNGSGKVNIHQEDMGGWVRVFTDEGATLPADIGVGLSLALTDWFRQRPQLRLHCAVPIVRDGNTVELHAWYELGVFPSVAAQTLTPT